MSSNECCICLDEISENSNRVLTDCGHVFHTSCLMKNVAINGFACPYCRNEMASLPSEDEYEDEEDEDEEDYIEDYVFRGLRLFIRRVECEVSELRSQTEEIEHECEEESEDSEEEYEENVQQEEQDQEQNGSIILSGGLRLPSPKYIVEKLQSKNISVEDLVSTLILLEHDDAYVLNDTTFERITNTRNKVYGAFRSIMSQFRPPVESNTNDNITSSTNPSILPQQTVETS